MNSTPGAAGEQTLENTKRDGVFLYLIPNQRSILWNEQFKTGEKIIAMEDK